MLHDRTVLPLLDGADAFAANGAWRHAAVARKSSANDAFERIDKRLETGRPARAALHQGLQK